MQKNVPTIDRIAWISSEYRENKCKQSTNVYVAAIHI